MPSLFLNMVQMTVTGTPGTGTVTLGSAATGYRSMAAAGALNQGRYSYTYTDAGSAWETGWGVYTVSGTTLTRNLRESSTGALLSLTSAAIMSIELHSQDLIAGFPDAPLNGTPPFL